MKTISKIFLSILFCFLFLAIFIFFQWSRQTALNSKYWRSTLFSAIKTKNQPTLNVMLLGLDKRDDDLEQSSVTDTIILAHIDFQKGKAHLFSLPRDLWDYSINSKINEIYPNSLKLTDKYEQINYIKNNFGRITGQKIDNVLILTTDNLKELADLLGGIDLYLENSFIDHQYPNPDYIKNPSPDIPIYKTVEFQAGWLHLDSSNITEFVRSRKSADTIADGGTDLGRIERQQQLITALFNKLKTNIKPNLLPKLYQFWQGLDHDFYDSEIIAYIIKNSKTLRNFQIQRHLLPAGEDPNKDLFYHPQKFINKQWVFLTKDRDFTNLHQAIQDKINES